MGPSGIGKSTILHMLSGIDHPSQGTIQLEDTFISHQRFEQRIAMLKNKISIIFQQPCLIAELTVLENIMLKAIIQEQINSKIQQHAFNLLRNIGLEDKAHCFPHTLSGGQQQRIAILRSILYVPQFLLADEPTGNLDQNSAQQIIDLLRFYQKKYAMGLIISTHDTSIAQQCDVILQIRGQKLILSIS